MDPFNQQPQQQQQQQQPQQQQQQPQQFQQQQQFQQEFQVPPQFQQMPQLSNAVFNQSQAPYGQLSSFSKPSRIPTKGWDPEKPLCAVILTVNNGSSYDALFRQVPQNPPEEGVAISLWQLQYESLASLEKGLRTGEKTGEEEIDEIISDINRAEAPSVLLNFECCGQCTEGDFGAVNSSQVFSLIRLFLDRQHTVNTGDFSTKSLIGCWDSTLLGPNPFIRTGEFSGNFELKFNPEVLLECPSAQLAAVGALCRTKGGAKVQAMSGTCMFSVDVSKADTTEYTWEVLTVMTNAGGRPVPRKDCSCTINGEEFQGCAGHVILRYPVKQEGNDKQAEERFGFLVVSAGHWIELQALDTDFESVKAQMLSNFGAQAASDFEQSYFSSSGAAQEQFLQTNAAMNVQCQAPVSYGNLACKKG